MAVCVRVTMGVLVFLGYKRLGRGPEAEGGEGGRA